MEHGHPARAGAGALAGPPGNHKRHGEPWEGTDKPALRRSREGKKPQFPSTREMGPFRDRPLWRPRIARFGSGIISLHDIMRIDYRGTIELAAMRNLTLADYQALAEFRHQIRRFLHFSEEAVLKAGMEKQQYQFMLAIKGMPPGTRPRIRELANRMLVQHHSAVELINRMESKGYVQRERGEDDRREVLLALTPKGEQVLAELARHHQDELRSAGPKLIAALQRLRSARRRPGKPRVDRKRMKGK
jgi:DNA-binding MarR family transcriptional regulator